MKAKHLLIFCKLLYTNQKTSYHLISSDNLSLLWRKSHESVTQLTVLLLAIPEKLSSKAQKQKKQSPKGAS